MPIGVFSKETAEQIYQWYQDTIGNDSRPDTLQYPDDWKQPWYLVKLTEDLAAASNPFTGYTQAKANVLRYTDSDNLYRVEVTETNNEILIINRLPDVSLSSGAFVWVKRVDAEYVPFAPGGPGGGGDIIHFNIIGVDCYTGYWEVEVTHYTRGCTEPVSDEEDTYGYAYENTRVIVRPYYTSPFTEDELINTGKGVATFTFNRQTCERYWLEISHEADQGC